MAVRQWKQCLSTARVLIMSLPVAIYFVHDDIMLPVARLEVDPPQSNQYTGTGPYWWIDVSKERHPSTEA
jgi:hypothetical protein